VRGVGLGRPEGSGPWHAPRATGPEDAAGAAGESELTEQSLAPRVGATRSRWSPLWPVLRRARRGSEDWPVSKPPLVPTRPAVAPQCAPHSGKRSLSLDVYGWLARSATATSRGVPGPRLVVIYRQYSHWPCRPRVQTLAPESMSRSSPPLAGF
jgi:hypothetical protein